MIHPKRGKKAMDAMNVLPVFTGIAVHDAFSPYFQYDTCGHALCHAHYLRELTAILDLHRQTWAKDMIDFLCTVKREIAQISELSPDRITK
jgi:transposase